MQSTTGKQQGLDPGKWLDCHGDYLYRYALVRHEDKSLNILESSAVASEQTRAFNKANRIQRIGIPLTLVVVVYGLTLAGVYFHQLWVAAGQIPR